MTPATTRRRLGLWAFVAALLVYTATRLIGLVEFPIYFFSDEAIQAVSAAELLRDQFRNSDGLLWPPYFKNYAVWNLSLSVYLQLLPVRLFGMSVFVTRLVSVWVGLLGVAAVAGALRQVFRARGWYLSVLVLAATPAWFIHSRTAFETAEMVAFYALFLYSYLLYRTRPHHPWPYAFAALLFAAAAFYSYSNGQAIIGLLGLALLVVDAPYHWRVALGERERRGEGEKGTKGDGERPLSASPHLPLSISPLLLFLAAAILLAYPYVRFRAAYPTDLSYHLRSLDSYWFHDAPPADKLAQFADRYAYGLSPAYWFRANDHDLIRHRFGPVAHMRPVFLPFLLIGLAVAVIRGAREQGSRSLSPAPLPPCSSALPAAYRAVLLALLAAPVGAALVNVAVTRVLSVVVPVTLLVGIGVDWVLRQIEIGRWGDGEIKQRQSPNLPISQSLNLAFFLLLTLMSLGTLRYALSDGPRWFEDYTLGGMQYGAAQLFPLIEQRLAADPTTTILLSPDWANGTDMFPRFFLSADDQRRVRTLNVDAFLSEQRPLDDTMLFIMLPAEVERATQSGKFGAVTVEETIAYPNGQPGFLLARMAYVEGVEAVFAAELAALRRPVSESLALDDGVVNVTHTRFEAGQLADLFDGDTFTLVRHIAANPVRYEFVFEEPRPVSGLAADLGTMDAALTVTLTPPPGAPGEAATYTADFIGLGRDPHVEMPFPDPPPLVGSMTLEIRDLNAGEDVKIHVRELRVTSDE